MNWYEEQFGNINPISENETREFDKWISEDTRSFNEIGRWGWNTVRSWMHWKGVYLLPTVELNDYILETFFPENEWSDERLDSEVVEICAGYGMLGRMLGFKMTDNHLQQRNKHVAEYYDLFRQPRINYPKDVILMEANLVPKSLHPHTVIGSYVTWGSKDKNECANLGANYYGPDMVKLYEGVNRVILIGNNTILAHTTNPILSFPHKEYDNIPGLLTRSKPSENRIWEWKK